MKRKTWQRLWGEINNIPFGKIKKVHGKDYAEKFKNLVLEYCLWVFYTQNKRTIIPDFYSYLLHNVPMDLSSINPLDDMKVDIWYSGKDGIHFKLDFETYSLDCFYSDYLEQRKENKVWKEQKQQFKYAARYYKGK